MHRHADQLAASFEEVVDVLETARMKHGGVVPAKRKLVGRQWMVHRLDRRKVEIGGRQRLSSLHRDVAALVSEKENLTRRGRHAGIR